MLILQNNNQSTSTKNTTVKRPPAAWWIQRLQVDIHRPVLLQGQLVHHRTEGVAAGHGQDQQRGQGPGGLGWDGENGLKIWVKDLHLIDIILGL